MIFTQLKSKTMTKPQIKETINRNCDILIKDTETLYEKIENFKIFKENLLQDLCKQILREEQYIEEYHRHRGD